MLTACRPRIHATIGRCVWSWRRGHASCCRLADVQGDATNETMCSDARGGDRAVLDRVARGVACLVTGRGGMPVQPLATPRRRNRRGLPCVEPQFRDPKSSTGAAP